MVCVASRIFMENLEMSYIHCCLWFILFLLILPIPNSHILSQLPGSPNSACLRLPDSQILWILRATNRTKLSIYIGDRAAVTIPAKVLLDVIMLHTIHTIHTIHAYGIIWDYAYPACLACCFFGPACACLRLLAPAWCACKAAWCACVAACSLPPSSPAP